MESVLGVELVKLIFNIMLQKIKRFLYFAFAWYFRIFAEIKLRRWSPKVIVITGSSGKTTLLHLVESQVGKVAKYSHHANSSIGIPFDILDLHRKTLTIWEWPGLIVKAPFMVFTPVPKESIYIVETDCDRPYEGYFLSTLLKPDITLWTNVATTHSMNFDKLVSENIFPDVKKAISYEFGYFAEKTKELVIINSDSNLIENEMVRTDGKIERISVKNELKNYSVDTTGTVFDFGSEKYSFRYLLPKEAAASILMSKALNKHLDLSFDPKFSKFTLPPGRSSVFKGIKNTVIVDSAYNANLDSMTAIVNMFSLMGSNNKWAVIGDMLELGNEEKPDHEELALLLEKQNYKKLILIGPRVSKYTYPKLKSHKSVVKYESPKDVLDYLKSNLAGGEVILFKGARFLEGVIENLLADKKDAVKLDRREKIWEIRRKKWGL